MNSISERQKETKLVLKICRNIISNPSQISKYGSLNWSKVYAKLTNCKFWLQLLLIAGFDFERKVHNYVRPKSYLMSWEILDRSIGTELGPKCPKRDQI